MRPQERKFHHELTVPDIEIIGSRILKGGKSFVNAWKVLWVWERGPHTMNIHDMNDEVVGKVVR